MEPEDKESKIPVSKVPSFRRKANNMRLAPLRILNADEQQRDAAIDQVRVPSPKQVVEVQTLEKIEVMIETQENGSEVFNKKNLIDKGIIGGRRDGLTTVRKMVHVPTNTVVAVKIWNFIILEEYQFKLVKQELADLKTLDCKYFIRTLHGFCEENCLRLVLEYMNKGSLADILQKLKVVPENFIGIIAHQCLKALDYLHTKQKLIYRELKPSNILINSDGDVKLADNTSIASSYAIRHQALQMELFYPSPEVIQGEKYTYSRDIWSLGLILLECALGAYPYDLSSPRLNFFEMLDLIISKPVPTLPDYFSYELRDFISKCLIKDVNSRPNTTELLKHSFIKKGESQSRELFKAWLEQA